MPLILPHAIPLLTDKVGKSENWYPWDSFSNLFIGPDSTYGTISLTALSKEGSWNYWKSLEPTAMYYGVYMTYKDFLETKIKRGYKDLETIVHSDQGSIYSSTAFNKLHENYTIKRSMSRAGTPTDNPVIESLNGWIKNELYKDFKIYLVEDINIAINGYIKYFNTQRLAYSLQYKTPVQYRTEQGFI